MKIIKRVDGLYVIVKPNSDVFTDNRFKSEEEAQAFLDRVTKDAAELIASMLGQDL